MRPRGPPKIRANMKQAIEEALKIQPGTGHPSEYSLPGFHDNVFARLLAANPKTDVLTRRVYPSTLLTRIGFSPTGEIRAVNPTEKLAGPRVWASSDPRFIKLPRAAAGRLNGMIGGNSRLKTSIESQYGAKHVLLTSIKDVTAKYLRNEPAPDRPVVCEITVTESTIVPSRYNISEVPELKELGLPSTIHNGKYGLHLAGLLCKYWYLYVPDVSKKE